MITRYVLVTSSPSSCNNQVNLTWPSRYELLYHNMIAFQHENGLIFSHRKALMAHSYSSIIWPLVTFRKINFLRNTPQVILVLNDTGLEFLSYEGLRKWVVTNTEGIRIIYEGCPNFDCTNFESVCRTMVIYVCVYRGEVAFYLQRYSSFY